MNIPEGWYKLEKGTLIEEGDKYYCTCTFKWFDSLNWKADFADLRTVGGTNNLIYIRKLKFTGDKIACENLQLKNALWRILRNPNRKSTRINARKLLKEIK